MIETTSPKRLRRRCGWLVLVAVEAIFLCGSTSLPSWAETAASTDKRFRTPQAIADHWVQAINDHDWREEYECYAGAQQAAFTYHLMLSTRELSDQPDLAIKLVEILTRYRFPTSILDEFPSHRLYLSALTDAKEIESAIQGQHEKRRSQLLRWEREVQPLDVDWAGLVEELQPLLTESHRRHPHGIHASATGMAHHLGFHRFDRASKIKQNGNRAEGSIVAIVRDSGWVADSDAITKNSERRSAISSFLSRRIEKLGFEDKQHIKRPSQKIAMVNQADGWKIDAVPYR